jgi:MFS family permease
LLDAVLTSIDPLNLPNWRKYAAIGSICFCKLHNNFNSKLLTLTKILVGALALSAETIIGALLPVFALQYSGIDPKILNEINLTALSPPGVVNLNPLQILAGLGGPPLWKISLLATLPLLTNGISSYFLVPLSISIGRRPVLLTCGVMAWSGGFWAGFSKSLDSHIAARCLQGIGAGAVEALIPLIVQDIVFIHQRNRAMSSIWSTQGLIIVSLGIASPVIVSTIGWRYLYFITSALAIVAWLGILFFLPESRWQRSQEELSGKEVYPLLPGETRPRINRRLPPRTLWTDLGVFTNGFENRAARKSMLDTVRTMFFPNILWVIVVNSILISISGAAGQTGSSILIAADWKFRLLGLAVVPIVIATPFVWLLGGFLADKVSNSVAKRNGGRREPEAHLLNLVLPLTLGVVGCVLFGYAGQHVLTLHWSVLLGSIFLIALGFLTANTVFSVYIVESYPQWAG